MGETIVGNYRLKVDYLDEGISLLVEDVNGDNVHFRGMVYTMNDMDRELSYLGYRTNQLDYGLFTVEYGKGEYIVCVMNGTVPIYTTTSLDVVRELLKEVWKREIERNRPKTSSTSIS